MRNSHHHPPYLTLYLRQILHAGWMLGQINLWSWKVSPTRAYTLLDSALEQPPVFDSWNDHHRNYEDTMRLESRADTSTMLHDKAFISAIAVTAALVVVAILCLYMLGWCFNRKQMNAYWARAAYPTPRTNNFANVAPQSEMGMGMGTLPRPSSGDGTERDSWSRRHSKVQRKGTAQSRNTPPQSLRPGPSSLPQHPIYTANSIQYAEAVVGAYPGNLPDGSQRNQAGSTRPVSLTYQNPPMAPVYGYQPNSTSNPNPGVMPNQFYPGAATSSASYAGNGRNQNTPKGWGAKLAARISVLSSGGASSTQVGSEQLSYVSEPVPHASPNINANTNTNQLPGTYPQSQSQSQSQPQPPPGPSNRQPFYARSSSSRSTATPAAAYPPPQTQSQIHPQTQSNIASAPSPAPAAGYEGEFNPYQYSQLPAGGSQNQSYQQQGQGPIILPSTRAASSSGHGHVPPYSSSHGHGEGGLEYKGDTKGMGNGKSALPRTPSQAGW